MNSKFCISYEAARLLKEKGYKRHVNHYYDENGFLHDLAYDENYDYQMSNNDLDLDHYAAPTKTEVIDWLDRKIHIGIGYDDLHSKWHYDITPVRPGTKTINNLSFSTRLEAEDAAIIKALELL